MLPAAAPTPARRDKQRLPQLAAPAPLRSVAAGPPSAPGGRGGRHHQWRQNVFDTGLTISDLRWLLGKGCARHAQETSIAVIWIDRCAPATASTSPATLFVLTQTGVAFASHAMPSHFPFKRFVAFTTRQRSGNQGPAYTTTETENTHADG